MFFLDLSLFFVFYIMIYNDKRVDMFVDIVPNRKSPPTILIRHSCREGGKAKKRTLANISKFPPETFEKIREILRGTVCEFGMQTCPFRGHDRHWVHHNKGTWRDMRSASIVFARSLLLTDDSAGGFPSTFALNGPACARSMKPTKGCAAAARLGVRPIFRG